MPTDSIQSSTGTFAWDAAGSWSLGRVPLSTDSVSIVGQSSGSLAVTIAASDPAYTVASLTESTPNTSALSENLSVAGSLTVSGATSITSGVLSITGNGSIALNTVTLSTSAEILEGGSGTPALSIASVTSVSASSGGTVLVDRGTATIGSVSGDVNVSIASATATVSATAGNSNFTLNAGQLNLSSTTTNFADTILLSNNSSNVDLQNIAYEAGETPSFSLVSSGIYNIYKITLKNTAGQTLYTFQNVEGVGNFNAQTAPTVTVVSDGASGTLVTLACYAAHTLIGVPGGQRPAGELLIGDQVLNAAGAPRPVKWIGRRSYAGPFLRANARVMPIRFRAGALGAGLPRRDLLVSPEHAMFIEGLLVPARSLVNGASVVQETALERIDYIHIELDTHDVILAEGAPSETFVDDNSRMCFHNASEFASLYPGQAATPAIYCAPRVEDGETVAAIRRKIDREAGLSQPDGPGRLQGFMDYFDGRVLKGWAQDLSRGEVPVCLEITVDGVVVAITLANQFRPDLLSQGLGSGCHSFVVRLPRRVRAEQVSARRLSDRALLDTLLLRRPAAA